MTADTGSTHFRIGLLLIPSDPYWIQTVEAIYHANRKFGDELVMFQPATSNQEVETISFADLIDQILANEIDVLINTGFSAQLIQPLLEDGVKVVCLSEYPFLRHPRLTVVSDLTKGGMIAGEYIAERLRYSGRAICVTASLENTMVTGQYRLSGFYQALQHYPGIRADHIAAYWDYSQTYASLLETLAKETEPVDAIFGVSDTIILAARDAGKKLGIVSDQTILVGLNGDPMALAAISEGELSATVDTSSEDLGATALEIAHRHALGLPVPRLIHQRYQLITQENVGSVATRKLAAIAGIPSNLVGYSRQIEQDRISQLEISTEIIHQIEALQVRQQVFQVVSDLVYQHYGYEWVRILQWSREEQKLIPMGKPSSCSDSNMPEVNDELAKMVFESAETLYIPDTKTSQRWRTARNWGQVRSRAILPIRLGDKVVGVLDLQSSRPIRRSTLEIVGLKLLASQLGIVSQNMDLYQEALQASQTAEKANQLKNRLMANVGHEMRSPLNSILGFSQSILKEIKEKREIPQEVLRSDIQNVYQSGEHLMYMINDLLDLSRAEIGALSLYFEPIQPVPFLQEVFTNFTQSQPARANLKWLWEVPDRLPLIRGDAVRLRQVILNLLVNAHKFTQSGSITLGASVEPPFLHFWVKDTGPGIPIELQEKIFEPFGTLSRKRRPEGVGLGLSITRHLVALHEGLISLESQAGVGCTFHIYLPLPGVLQEPLRVPPKEGQLTMLVISKSAQIPPEVLEVCKRQQWLPLCISNRSELNEALAQGKPQAVAWDCEHASVSDWQLFHQFSNQSECMALPILMYGASESSGQLSTALTQIMVKPFSGNTIKEWFNVIAVDQEHEGPILVVDDAPEVRAYFQALLADASPHRTVVCAKNGRQALEIIQSQVPSLVVLDLVMPEVDGFTVLEKIRSNPDTQCVPVIICSGKLLTYEDIQRLNQFRTTYMTKGILDQQETQALFDPSNPETRPLPQPTSQLVKQVLAFIHQNYAQPMNRKDIAASIGVSDNYLSQIFRQEVSISPWDYLSRFRIQKAKELLRRTQNSVTQVALQVGFNDSAYFSRVFHKQVGCTPQEFRIASRRDLLPLK